MEKVKILIVEDEPIIAEEIAVHIGALGYKVLGIFDNGVEALKAIGQLKPDLVLLDISLKGDMDGVEVAKRINETSKTPFVFLTSYADKPTIDRVKVTTPAGYIVKPFDERDLQSTVEIAIYRDAKGSKEETNDNFSTFLNDCFFIKSKNNQLVKICLDQILWFEAFDNYTYIKVKDNKHLICGTLKKIESKVDHKGFMRIHRSYLIALDKIESIQESNVVINNFKIPIGKTHKDTFMNAISIF